MLQACKYPANLTDPMLAQAGPCPNYYSVMHIHATSCRAITHTTAPRLWIDGWQEHWRVAKFKAAADQNYTFFVAVKFTLVLKNSVFIYSLSLVVGSNASITFRASWAGRSCTNLQFCEIRYCWHLRENRPNFFSHPAWAHIAKDLATSWAALTGRKPILLPADWEFVLPALAGPVGTHHSIRIHQDFIAASVLDSIAGTHDIPSAKAAKPCTSVKAGHAQSCTYYTYIISFRFVRKRWCE